MTHHESMKDPVGLVKLVKMSINCLYISLSCHGHLLIVTEIMSDEAWIDKKMPDGFKNRIVDLRFIL